jgi:hypothetical protein
MPTEAPSPENALRYYRRLLKTREAEQRILIVRKEAELAKAPPRRKLYGVRDFNFWKVKSDAEIQDIKQKIAGLEQQIAMLAEAERAQPAEQLETPTQDAPESSTKPSKPKRWRDVWQPKPPRAPGQKRRTG